MPPIAYPGRGVPGRSAEQVAAFGAVALQSWWAAQWSAVARASCSTWVTTAQLLGCVLASSAEAFPALLA
eukprot:4970121-Alexandrium_andersonii.AAC.1